MNQMFYFYIEKEMLEYRIKLSGVIDISLSLCGLLEGSILCLKTLKSGFSRARRAVFI